ncbi:MAG: C4-dicarboxylate ABC transporter substrate-binding protein, partial [Pseudomonadota bacterium]|nr:C4-dicarboxylate ABC transporter substrate-binding protein [Pseudomonadota bacterium]
MKNITAKLTVSLLALTIAGEAAAKEWKVSVWVKRRAFTEHDEK